MTERASEPHARDGIGSPWDGVPQALFDPLTRAAAASCEVPTAFVTLAAPFAPNHGNDDDDEARGFQASAPLTSSRGVELGRLCVADPRPRSLSDAQRATLHHLAAAAAQLLEQHVESSAATARARSAEQRVATIFKETPGMLHSIDADGIVLAVSDAWLRELGVTRSTVIGRPVFDFFTPASQRHARETVIPSLFASGRCDGIAYQMVRSDGSVIDVLVSAFIERDAAGKALGSITISQNITLRRQAEHALREEQERMARILEGTDAGTWELNIDTGETQYNARWAEMAGYTLAELGKTTGATWRGLMHPDDLPVAVAHCIEHFEGKCPYYRMECRIRHKSGAWMWILDRGRVSARDADGRALWMHGTRTDITARKHAEEALRASQDFLERVGQVAGVGGWAIDCATGRLSWSDATRQLLDIDDDFKPKLENVLLFVKAEARDVLDQAIRHSIASCASFDLELPFVSARGRPLWARAVGTAESVDGKAIRLVGALQDVTRRKQMERDLAENRELLQVTLESIGDAVITTDNDSVVQWLNPAAERMTGWPRSEAVGRTLTDVFVIVDETTRAPKADPVARCLRHAEVVATEDQITLVSRTGVDYAIEDSASPIRRADRQVQGAVLVFHDVSEQRRLNREMSHRATHDPLTGLFNRGEFETRLSRMLERVRDDDVDNALLYIDLDQFKVVNDTCGHDAGDRLLRQVSAILARCVRADDTLARLGGDEFGVILERCAVADAGRVAQKMCDEMEVFRFQHDGRRFRVGTSIGLVPIDSRFTTIKTLLQAADASCYAAKEGGRNRVHAWFDSDQMLKDRQGDTQWVSRIENAIDEDRFELFGQCIQPVDGSAGKLHLEVLLRLRDANGELILPAAFLPAAERFHLITRIDRWVIRHVFARMDLVGSDDAIGMVSVNLSGQSLGDRAFHRDVIALLEAASFDRRKLCFEVTETAAITHLAEARTFIEAVRALGVHVALDDFGAGASSFGYLKSLPVDFLKIDGHFVTHLLQDALHHAAVRCFCDVAKVVGVRTVAESVEREDVRNALRDIGVDLAQGFLIHRPAPLGQLLVDAATITA